MNDMPINITSIDNTLLLRLRDKLPISYEVHSRFAKAVNLIDQKGAMITLLCDALPNGPSTALVNIPSFSSLSKAIDVGQKFVYHSGLLANQDIEFSFANKPLIWESTISPINRAIKNAEIDLISELLMAHEALISPLDMEIENSVALYISQKLRESLEELIQALFYKNNVLVKVYVEALIGLGQGLTPSGDDRLLGLMLVLYLYGNHFQDEIYQIEQIIDNSQDKTHDISWWMLHHGSLGQFNEWLLDYGNLLSKPFQSDSLLNEKACLFKILSIGSQSGGDMVTGILSGLKLVKMTNIEWGFK